MSFEFSQFLCIFTQGILTVDPLPPNLTFSFLSVLALCNVEWFTLFNPKVMNLFLSPCAWHFALLQVQSSSPAHSVANLSQTPSDCASATCVSTLCGCTGRFSFQLLAFVDCHHFVLLHTKTCLKVLITTLGLSLQTHPIAHHVLLAITSQKYNKFILTHIYLAILQVLVYIFPPNLVCVLHPFFQALERLSLTIHGAARILIFLQNGICELLEWDIGVVLVEKIRFYFLPILLPHLLGNLLP